MLDYRMAGGLGLEPRLAESESSHDLHEIRGNASTPMVCGRELQETATPKSGFIRHIIVTLKCLLKGCSSIPCTNTKDCSQC